MPDVEAVVRLVRERVVVSCQLLLARDLRLEASGRINRQICPEPD